MEPNEPRAKHGPEFHIQSRFIAFFSEQGWEVERMTGNAFQKGVPDLYLMNRTWGQRWVDIKVHGRYEFTPAQIEKWPKWDAQGVGIWIIGAPSPEECTKELMLEQQKLLFNRPNWRDFWKDRYGTYQDIDEVLNQVKNENPKWSIE